MSLSEHGRLKNEDLARRCRFVVVDVSLKILTLGVRYMLDHVAIFNNLNYAADEPLCTLGCVVDRDKGVGSFGRSRHFDKSSANY